MESPNTGFVDRREGGQKSSPATGYGANKKRLAHSNYEIPAGVSTDTIRALPVKTLQACPEGQLDDQAFFTENPDRAYRLRPALIGEILLDHNIIGRAFVVSRRVAQRLTLQRPLLAGPGCAESLAEAGDAVGAMIWHWWNDAFAADPGDPCLSWGSICAHCGLEMEVATC